MRFGSRRTALALSATLMAAALACGLLAAPARAGGHVLRIHLVWTNDVHGHVASEGATFISPNFPPPLGGGASAAAYVEKLRGEVAGKPDEAVVLVDAGDTWQGAPVGTLSAGLVMEEYFNALDYDVVIPGNHEFDKGKEVPIRMAANMKRKFVCANIFKAETYRDGTGELVDWVEPYRIVERAGLRIGIIGATTPGTRQMAFAEHIQGLEFGPILPAVEKYRDILNQEGVDVVFLVVHEGLPFDSREAWKDIVAREARGENIRAHLRGAIDLAHVLEGVPVIVGGHTHRGYRDPWIDPVTQTMVLETFGNGSSLGHVVLKFDAATKMLVGWESPRRDGVLVTLFEDEWWPEPEMREKLRPFIEESQKGLDVKVGSTRVELSRRGGNNSIMGNFVTEAMRSVFDADLAFTNTGGLRADLPEGDITAEGVFRVLPFDNTVVIVRLDGRTLRRLFDRRSRRGSSGVAQSGAQLVVDPDAPEGGRILEFTIGGRPVHPDSVYRAVTTDYLMEGNSGFDLLAQIPQDQVEYTQMLWRDVVTRYLEKNSPVRPRRDDRWVEKPGAEMAPYLRGWESGARAPGSN